MILNAVIRVLLQYGFHQLCHCNVAVSRHTRVIYTGIVNLIFVFEQRSIWIGALVMRHPVWSYFL